MRERSRMKKDPAALIRHIEELKKHPHCVNCGRVDPETFGFSEGQETALTPCCQESICERNEEYRFGNEEVSVKACCWAMAELQFQWQGIDVARQKGMHRSKLDS